MYVLHRAGVANEATAVGTTSHPGKDEVSELTTVAAESAAAS